MATESKARSSSDEAILRERERSNQAVLRVLASRCESGEEKEQRETLDDLKRALDEDRPSGRSFSRNDRWSESAVLEPGGSNNDGEVRRELRWRHAPASATPAPIAVDEILGPVRREFEENGMSEEELAHFVTEVRDEVRRGKRTIGES
jgi:hypothetical protein